MSMVILERENQWSRLMSQSIHTEDCHIFKSLWSQGLYQPAFDHGNYLPYIFCIKSHQPYLRRDQTTRKEVSILSSIHPLTPFPFSIVCTKSETEKTNISHSTNSIILTTNPSNHLPSHPTSYSPVMDCLFVYLSVLRTKPKPESKM